MKRCRFGTSQTVVGFARAAVKRNRASTNPRCFSFSLFAAMSLCLVTSSAVSVAMVYVDDCIVCDGDPPDPPCGTPLNPSCTIQDGIDAAVDADTVALLRGTHTCIGNKDPSWSGHNPLIAGRRAASGNGVVVRRR
ncbi:MAG: hypothetical protein ACE5E6_09475 [Phycisphaerae bacterium]